MRKINIPIFVSHQGCPNDCIFCNQKKITGVYKKEKEEEIREKIKTYLDFAPQICEIEISFFGGSFTGIETEEQNMYLGVANEFLKDSRITGIRLSTRPDYINGEILENLKRNNVTAVELGVQSLNDKVLYLNKRGLTSDAVYKACKLIKEYDFSLGLQMMLGMYGSTEEDDLYTAEELIKLKPDCVRIYPTVVIKETELFKLYSDGLYKPYSLEEAVRISSKILRRFNEVNIPVIRLGLMASDEINEKNVFGPYHSSFRELVESYIFYEDISEEIKRKGCGKSIIVYCNKKDISKVTGNKRSNIEKLKREFNLISLKVKEKQTYKKFEIEG